MVIPEKQESRKSLSIMEVTVKNVHAVKEARLDIDDIGNLVITGSNGAGKSSIMDSIWYVLGGEGVIPGNVVRQGEDYAHCRVAIGEIGGEVEYIAERIWDEDGKSKIKLSSPTGLPTAPAQTILNGLISRRAFDPWAFAMMKPKDRRDALLKIVKLELDAEKFKVIVGADPDAEVDALSNVKSAYDDIYKQREDINRDVTRAARVAEKFTTYVKVDSVSVTELVREKERLQGINRANDAKRDEEAEILKDYNRLKQEHAELLDQIEKLIFKSKQIKVECDQLRAKGSAVHAEVAKLVDEDVSAVQARIDDADATNEAAQFYIQRLKAEEERDELQEQSDDLSSKLKGLLDMQAAMLAAATYPIPGMGFDEGDITLDGIPYAQTCTSEKIRMAMAIAIEDNPILKFIRCQDASLMDGKTMQLIDAIGREHGYQIMLERVGDEPGVIGWFVEDGMVTK